MKTTTLNKIRSYNPCKDSYVLLLKSLNKTKPDDEPLSFRYILDTVGIQDAVWCLRTLQYKEFCLFSADIAETVLHIFEANQPEDSRPREAIEAIRKFHSGEITEDQLAKAAVNAYEAAYANGGGGVYNASYDAARAAAYGASYTAAAANAAAYAASYAASYAANAAYANSCTTYEAAAAKAEKWKEIKTLFLKHFC